MHIAIVGTGRVGAVLGTSWASQGHMISYVSRDPDSDRVKTLLAAAGPNVTCRPLKQAVELAGLIVVAIPWSAVEETLHQAGDLAGKVLIDCTNPIEPGLRSAVDDHSSGAEQIAAWAPGARVVKAFNTTGSNNMEDPVYGPEVATMFVCSDDTLAKAAATELASELGFEVVDAGPLSAARHLENLAFFWIHLAMVDGLGREIAFRLLRR